MRSGALVGIDPDQTGDVVQKEQEVAVEVLQGESDVVWG